MNWFKLKESSKSLEETLATAVDAALRRAREDWMKLSNASAELVRTKQEIEQLKIERDRINEEHERQRREIEHKVGLEKNRQEQELALGKREAVLAVGEKNLAAEQAQFEKNMKFAQDRFEDQFKAMREHLNEVTKRLPQVNWNIDEARGAKKRG